MSDCDTILALLDPYLDGTLVAGEQARVSVHLAACERCQREAEATRALLARTRTLPGRYSPAGNSGAGSRSESAARPRGGTMARSGGGYRPWLSRPPRPSA